MLTVPLKMFWSKIPSLHCNAAPECDPISSYLPKIVDDEDIFVHFLRIWKFYVNEQVPTTVSASHALYFGGN